MTHLIDANILIDLGHMGLEGEVFALGIDWETTDLVVHEAKSLNMARLIALGLKVRTLNVEQLNEVIRLGLEYKTVSATDRSLLLLAEKENKWLITGDRSLRKAAGNKGVVVHGLLWLLDEMIRSCIITQARAAVALQEAIDNGSRLPKDEAARRFRKWLTNP